MKKILPIILILILVLTGCSSSGGGGNSGGGNSGGEAAPSGGGEATLATIQAPTPLISMDSALATDGTSFIAQTMCLAGLMELDANGNPIPDLAESYELSEDGLKYTFKLRDDIFWSNGDPVTANDFEFAWKRVAHPDTASDYGWIFETANIKNGGCYEADSGVSPDELGVTAVDDKTLEVELIAPSGFFLQLTAFPSFFPINQAFYEAQGDQYALSTDNILYCGPYKLSSWTAGYSFEFEQNPDYWNASNFAGKYADKVVFREISDAQTALMEYDSKNIDTVQLSGEQVDANKDVEGFTNRLSGYMFYLNINMKNDPGSRPVVADLDNVNIRKAISYAINREALATVLNDGSVGAEGIIPFDLASNPNTGKDFREDAGKVTEFDQEKAKEFYAAGVAELGHDVTFELLYGSDEGDSVIKAAEQIQFALEEVGFTVNLNPKPKKERLALARNDHEYEVTLTRWGPDYGDPQTYMDLFVSTNVANNWGGWANADYDALVDDAENGAGIADPLKRWENFIAAEKVLVADDAAVIPIFQAGGAMIINPAISGIEFHSASVDNYRHIVVNK